MTTAVAANVDASVRRAIEARDFGDISRTYWDQGEVVFLDRFFPHRLAEQLIFDAERVLPHATRGYVPGHKKAGAVSFHTLLKHAPVITALYESPALLDFLKRLVQAPVVRCPEEDLHSCALYVYTEPGDHIGWHYDTSYYKGNRYTMLVGLIERSVSCRLVAQLYKDDPRREPKEIRIDMDPGSVVIFNSDKLWHAVTPLEAGAERVMLTLQFVTRQEMAPLKRILSNLKDAFVYFGPAALRRRKFAVGNPGA
jgi:alkylated DNA repair dioxygenase AlkB